MPGVGSQITEIIAGLLATLFILAGAHSQHHCVDAPQ